MDNLTFTWGEICEKLNECFGIDADSFERYTLSELLTYIEYIYEYELSIIHADELLDIEKGN